MPIIKNRRELLSHGSRDGRKVVLDVLESAIGAVSGHELVRQSVVIAGNSLRVGSLTFDLSKTGDLYVIGAGKGSLSIAKGLEEILGSRIKTGLVIEKRGQGRKLKSIEVVEADHPIPDDDGVRATKKILDIADNAKTNDLVFVCVTGGCSALMTIPADGLSLDDVRELTQQVLMCGASLRDINTVRKHISKVMGGRLAMRIHPAQTIGLIIVDEVEGRPWGPTVPDTTTFRDALHVLKKYNLLNVVPVSVRKHLEKAEPEQETPKLLDFQRQKVKVHNWVLANSETLCEAAQERAKELGCNAMILSTALEGESREAGTMLACIAREVEEHMRPLHPPCVLIVGGETTVTIRGQHGEGGRNQEFALAASLKIEGSRKTVIASVGTDGTDGPTDAAGAIADGYTAERAREMKTDVYENLAKHNSYHVFRQLEDAVFTRPTGTNVMDLRLAYVSV
ncbi:MAG: glycerate kinase [Candidatus Bathyarchaeia archaeon]|jgi:glycerate-2-kinase